MQTYEKYKILLCTNRLQSAGLLIKISVHEQLISTQKIFAWIFDVQYKKKSIDRSNRRKQYGNCLFYVWKKWWLQIRKKAAQSNAIANVLSVQCKRCQHTESVGTYEAKWSKQNLVHRRQEKQYTQSSILPASLIYVLCALCICKIHTNTRLVPERVYWRAPYTDGWVCEYWWPWTSVHMNERRKNQTSQ